MGLQRSSPLSLPISIGAQSIPPRLVSPQQRSTGLVDAGLAVHSSEAVISEPALRAFALQESRNFRLLADTEHSHLPQFRRSRIGVAQTRHAAGFQSTQDAGFAGTECCPLSLLRGRWLQICSRLPAKKNRPDQDQPGRFLCLGVHPVRWTLDQNPPGTIAGMCLRLRTIASTAKTRRGKPSGCS